MKTCACLALCMAMTIFLSASTLYSSDFVKCRDYPTDWGKGFSTTQLIEHDLINGDWNAVNDAGMKDNYMFLEGGLLQLIYTHKNGNKSCQSNFWKIVEKDGQPIAP